LLQTGKKGGVIMVQAIDELRKIHRGPIMLPGDAGYDDARSIWNAMIDRRPAVIARCLGATDVIACVNHARDQGLPLSIKGGGHNIAGLAVVEESLMLDMSAMRGVWVDPNDRIARAQPGCLLGDVDRETQAYGLAAALGFISNTGIAGLTLGGGFGYLSRRFGWTCDTVQAFDMVTAQGRLVHASADENYDLFWALRGGGGNFGVVTGIEYHLFPVGPEIVGGLIAWPAERAPEVLDLFGKLSREAPDEMALAAVLRIAPPAPWLAQSIHGKPIIALVLCDSGPIAEAERRAAPLKAFGTPVGDIIQRRPYVAQQSILDATQPKGRRNYWKSDYLKELTPSLLEASIERAKSLPSPHSSIVFFPLGGAVLNERPDFSPMGNRDAALVLNITASWEKPADDERSIGWARSTFEDLRRFTTGRGYINFMTEEESAERVRSAYGENYQRLAKVKAKWDPSNMFRANKNIVPIRELSTLTY
jgi:FAD/FMN-containing dehydrogenase